MEPSHLEIPEEKSSQTPEDTQPRGLLRALGQHLNSLTLLGVVSFVFVTSFPPFDQLTETNLAAHMLQHIIIMFCGIMIVYPYYRAGKFARFKGRGIGIAAFVCVAAILVIWHVPLVWNAAVQDFWLHFLEHVSFLGAGCMIGSYLLALPDNFKLFAVAIAISAHDIYGFALFLTPVPVYPPSPVSQQSFLGLALFGPSPIYVALYLVYTLAAESRKLEEMEMGTDLFPKRRHLLRRKATSVLVISLVLILGGYFVTASVTILASSQANLGGATVYIIESPVYWQYSPQNITVVLGINNTVTWVSHSYTIDTVTSNIAGLFSSPAMSPGSSFSFTFQKTGVYAYHCQYHPWMQGTVTVLASS